MAEKQLEAKPGAEEMVNIEESEGQFEMDLNLARKNVKDEMHALRFHVETMVTIKFSQFIIWKNQMCDLAKYQH